MRGAALQIVPDGGNTAPDPKVQRPSKVIGQINRLGTIDHVIALLPSLSDDGVIETRNAAGLLRLTGWKIQIACDAEIWDRTERAMNGRGNVDVEEKGILAAVNKRAEEIGCGASTVRKNAQLFKRFKKVLIAEHVLDDKGFYQAAMAADDPDAAIEVFTKERRENPRYKVADAWRYVKEPAPGPKEDETRVLQTPEAQAWLTAVHASLLSHMPTVPLNAPVLKTLIQSIDGVVLRQSERTVEGDCRTIMQAIEETGGLSGDDLMDWQVEHFYFMSEEQLKSRLLSMVADKQIVEDDAGPLGRQAKRRGALPKWYVAYYTKRKKPEGAMCPNCLEWHRDPADCLEIGC